MFQTISKIGDKTLKVQICWEPRILQLAPVCTRITLRAVKNYALRVIGMWKMRFDRFRVRNQPTRPEAFHFRPPEKLFV